MASIELKSTFLYLDAGDGRHSLALERLIPATDLLLPQAA
jgi:hypothetical protein